MFQANLLQGKVILVTGGGTGLGRAMGERFLELGAKLAICGRRQEVAEQAAARYRPFDGWRDVRHSLRRTSCRPGRGNDGRSHRTFWPRRCAGEQCRR